MPTCSAPAGPLHTLRCFALAAAAAALLSAGLFPQAKAASLSESVERAILQHPEIQSLTASTRAAWAAVDISESLSRPKFGVQAKGGLYAGKLVESDTFTLSFNATKPLIDGGAARSDRQRSVAEAAAAGRRLEDTATVIALQAVQAHLEVLRSAALLKIVKRSAAGVEDIARRQKLRVEAGFGGDADRFEADARVDAALAELAAARRQAADAVTLYQSVTGRKPGSLAVVAPPDAAMPQNVDAAVRLSRRTSPKILAIQYEALAAEAVARGHRAASRPKLDFDLGLNYNTDHGSTLGETRDLTAALSFRFDLYDGGASKARGLQARHLAAARHTSAAAAALDAEREVRLAWNLIRATRQRIEPLKRQQANIRRSLALNLQRFDAGLVPLDKILDLQAQAAAAETASLNENFALRFNVFRILGATGRLFPALGIRLKFQQRPR